MVQRNAPIAIVGGGAWGLSTALHLTNAGYTNITVFERAEQIPSPYSAAWDINKIVRAEYEDPFYTKLALVSTGLLAGYIIPYNLEMIGHSLISLADITAGSNRSLENTLVWPLLSSDRIRSRSNRQSSS